MLKVEQLMPVTLEKKHLLWRNIAVQLFFRKNDVQDEVSHSCRRSIVNTQDIRESFD